MLKELDKLESRLFRTIEKSAAAGEGEKVVALSGLLEEMNSIQKSVRSLKSKVDTLSKKIREAIDPLDKGEAENPGMTAQENPAELSPYQKGEIRRKNFLAEIKRLGIRLKHQSGVKYHRMDGRLIGIASATESDKERWFLGLPQENYASIVLLCEDSEGIVSPIIMPAGFIEDHKNYFSRSQDGGEIKFNIRKEFGRWMISIPGRGSEDVGKMIHAHQNLLS